MRLEGLKDEVFSMCSCQGAEENDIISGGNGEGVPPVPIPNTEVKPFSAESTWLDTAREDRSPPDSNRKRNKIRFQNASIAQWQSIRLLTEGL